jgi:tetratricopeptide (TPR) repeat protein
LTWHRVRRGAFALLLAAQAALAQDTLRPEVGKPLQATQELLKAGKYAEALARLRDAEALPNRTPYEDYLIERLRGSAAVGAGEAATAIKAFEAVLASGRLQSAEKLAILEALANTAYRAKDYPKAIDAADRFFKQGGENGAMRNLVASAHYLSGDYAGVVREMRQRVEAVERSIPTIDETTLRMLAASYAKLGNEAGYVDTLEKLLVHHPKKDYWADRLARLAAREGFPDRLTLDLYRLKLATGTLDDTTEYAEMAQLALQAALPTEAQRVVEAGFAAGKLGQGADAARHRRLRELATTQAAEDAKSLGVAVASASAEGMVKTGQALVSAGQVDRGIGMIEQGLAKGTLKRPDDARLYLGQAYGLAGHKAKAVETFKAVRGNDGLADLARLWAIHLGRP